MKYKNSSLSLVRIVLEFMETQGGVGARGRDGHVLSFFYDINKNRFMILVVTLIPEVKIYLV